MISFLFQMLQTILRKVSTFDLLRCRRVNRLWNDISTQTVHQRSDISIRFAFTDEVFLQQIEYRRCDELLVDKCGTYIKYGSKTLSDLVMCLEDSENFPIGSFRFDKISEFTNEDVRTFLGIWGTKILKLEIVWDCDSSKDNFEILRKFMFEKVPNLRTLKIIAPSTIIHHFADEDPTLQLPKLEVLAVDGLQGEFFGGEFRGGEFRGLIECLLMAASNLKRFVGPYTYHVTKNDLTMLKLSEKIHCIENIRIRITEDFIAFWNKSMNNVDLRLKSLKLSFEGLALPIHYDIQLAATRIVDQLLSSSEDCIQTLEIGPLEWLTGVVIPKLENLETLRLCLREDAMWGSTYMFPPSLDLAETFPNVKELGM